MGVRIEFRGVLLCRSVGDDVVEILLPNAKEAPPWVEGGGEPWKHPDASGATLHHAGIAWRRQGATVTVREPFTRGRPVRIGSGELHPALDATMRAEFADLATLMSGAELKRPNGSVWTSISISGAGRVVPGQEAVFPFDLEGRTLRYLSFYVYLDADRVEVTGVTANAITFVSGDDVIVFCYEKEDATLAQLRHEGMQKCEREIVDADFRWLYSMLRPKQGSTPWPPQKLPAPRYDCSRFEKDLARAPRRILDLLSATPGEHSPRETVSVSTCFPGLWMM